MFVLIVVKAASTKVLCLSSKTLIDSENMNLVEDY